MGCCGSDRIGGGVAGSVGERIGGGGSRWEGGPPVPGRIEPVPNDGPMPCVGTGGGGSPPAVNPVCVGRGMPPLSPLPPRAPGMGVRDAPP